MKNHHYRAARFPLRKLPSSSRSPPPISTEETNAKNTHCQTTVTSSLLKILCIDKIGSRPRRILCVDKIASRPRGILVFAHFLFENRPMITFPIIIVNPRKCCIFYILRSLPLWKSSNDHFYNSKWTHPLKIINAKCDLLKEIRHFQQHRPHDTS